jgi:hypothetical protein
MQHDTATSIKETYEPAIREIEKRLHRGRIQ